MAQSALAQGPTYPVKLGVVKVGDSLEVQLRPGANWTGAVYALNLTVRWNNADVSLGTGRWKSSAVGGYMTGTPGLTFDPLQDSLYSNGGMQYRHIYVDGDPFNTTYQANWTANVAVPILRFPILDEEGECVVFDVEEDAYMGDGVNFPAEADLRFAISLGPDPNGTFPNWFIDNQQDGTFGTSIILPLPSLTAGAAASANTSSDGTGNCSAVIDVANATIGDACPDRTLTYALTGATTGSGTGQVPASQAFNVGVTTITYTVTDANGLTATATQTVTVTDDEDPTVTAAANVTTTTSADGTGNCAVAVAITNASFGDNCSGSTLGYVISGATTGSGSGQVGTFTFNKGVSTIIYTVTDASSNTMTDTMTVTVTDDEDPTISCVGNQSRNTDSGVCTYTAVGTEFNPTFGDNCSGATVTNDFNNGSTLAGAVFPLGTTTVIWTVTDASNRTATCSLTVTVSDDQAPVITGTIAATTLEGCNVGVVPAAVTTVSALEALGLSISDACTSDANLVVTSSDSNSGSCPIVVTRTYTVTDANNNSSTYQQTINVDDSTAPAITGTIAASTVEGCAANAVPAAVTTVAALEELGLSISDACTSDANLVVTSSDSNSGSCPIVVTRTYTVTDACGNFSTYQQTINVDDSTAPAITGTIAASTVEGCAANAVPAAVTTVAALEALGLSISDACTADGALVVTSSDSNSGSCPIVVTRTYTVTDACGNFSTYEQTINVDDSTAPAITGTIAASTVEGCAANAVPAAVTTVAALEALGLSISDACTADGALVVTSSDSSTGTCLIVVTRTYTVTDACGNSSTYEQTINVDDSTAPVITLNGSATVELCQGGVYTESGATASDNCSGDLTNAIALSGSVDVNTPGTYTLSYNVQDACGNNAATVTRSVIVNALPAITLNVTGLTCTATNDGAISASVSGGEAPYGYSWNTNPVQTTSSISALAAGSYTVTVTDNNTCSAQATGTVGVAPHTGTIWYVDDAGSNSNTGNAGCPFATIQFAIGAASNGHQVNVASGTYAENVVVDKSLDIRGANYGVAGNGTRGSESIVSGSSGTGVQVQANNVVFDGFEVTGHDAGVSIAPATAGNLTGVKVRNNRVHDVDGAGIAAGAAYDGTLRAQTGLELTDNEVYATAGPAVQLRGITAASDSLRVWRNILRNAPVALWLDDARLVSVKANELRDAATAGLHVTSGNAAAVPEDVAVLNNSFVDNTKGLFVEAMAADGLLVNSNSFTGSGTHIDHDDADLLAATCNWLGSDVPATVQGTVQGNVSFIPWLVDGAETLAGQSQIGFQPLGVCAGYPVTLQVKAMLQGAYVLADGLMRDNLRSGGLIPSTQPYTGLGFANVEGSMHTANMNVTGANAIVDWVLVELRSVPTPNNAASANQVVKRRAALIQRDGDIVDLDGVSPIRLWDMERAFYYVAVRHRNHLGTMTATSRYLGGEPEAINFTTTETFGQNAQKTVAVGVNALWSSNARPDVVVKYTGPNNDRDPILLALPSPSPNAVLTNTYHLADGNLDGLVKYTGVNNDRDPILSNVGGTTPTAVRQQRLP